MMCHLLGISLKCGKSLRRDSDWVKLVFQGGVYYFFFLKSCVVLHRLVIAKWVKKTILN